MKLSRSAHRISVSPGNMMLMKTEINMIRPQEYNAATITYDSNTLIRAA